MAEYVELDGMRMWYDKQGSAETAVICFIVGSRGDHRLVNQT